MRAFELHALLSEIMAEKGFGGEAITCNGGFQIVVGVEWCQECNQFHIITEPITEYETLKITTNGSYMNYRELLKKYIRYIEKKTGANYLTSIDTRAGSFNAEEWRELKEIHKK